MEIPHDCIESLNARLECAVCGTRFVSTCRHCGLEIEQLVDSCGYTRLKGRPYGWHHVAATENADGQYALECADRENEAEPVRTVRPS
ncbi:MAG TPA: hypothetical protein VKZ53_18460 [Candidatus Angelobacter sp.]|nr:hypothetical protein [Candidatus Angelobacter sp.]